MSVYTWAFIILFLVWLLSRQYEYRCPLCDFHSKLEKDVDAHILHHAKHKPERKEIW